MNSVDKLRGDDASLGDLERRLSAITGCGFIGDALNVIADEIEREIEERYMKLPVDADGVPIRAGDILERVGGGWTFTADSLEIDRWGAHIRPNGQARIQCANCRHAKQRTLEDIMKDAIEYGHGIYPPTHCYDTKVSELCAEIRELMCGDAE